jgi:hypothetical protein
MLELGAASEDEVVLAFLRAEIDSPHWGPLYLRVMSECHLDRGSLIDAADLTDAHACGIRRVILGAVRGYGRDALLFTGFPRDTAWRRVRVEPSDLHLLKCISRDEHWSRLTAGTRLIREAAHNLSAHPQLAARVLDVIQRIEQGLSAAELIIVEAGSGDLILVEGHTRAMAYAVLSDRPFLAFVGTSPQMGGGPSSDRELILVEWHLGARVAI